MSRISLLPPEIRAVRKTQRKQGRLFLLFLILLIVLVAINLFFIVNAYFVSKNLKSLQEERALVEVQASTLLEYEEIYQQLGSAEKMVNDAMGTVPPWSVILNDLGETLPVGTQLSELKISYSGQSGAVSMLGSAYGHSGLAAMLEQLYTIKQLDGIVCRSSTETGTEGREVIQFVVDSLILTGPVFLSDEEGGE